MHSPSKKRLTKGQTIIGILIALAIFTILSRAIFTLASTSYEIVNFNRARVTGRHLAQEKMEFIRNLPYDDVGTIGGSPPGTTIPQEEIIRKNGLNYLINTDIIYIDDNFDGTLGGTPEDLLPTDYKRVRVEVSWEGLASSRKNPIVLVSDVTPRDIETTVGGGTLSILVFDALGEPVSQAQVAILAPSVSIDLDQQTGANGRIILPGMPECVSCYEITVTKSGYTSERTYSTSEIANPAKPHQTVLESQLTEISFAIDQVSVLNVTSVNSRDSGFTPAPNISFTLRGTKTLGTDTLGIPVLKYSEEITTDGAGLFTVSDLEWDNYEIVPLSASTWDISGVNPHLPFTLEPNQTLDLTFANSAHSDYSLLASFVDTSMNPIASVSAHLTDGFGFDETTFSGSDGDPDFGQVFFTNLSNLTYTLEATVSGFLDFSGNIQITGNDQETIILTPE